MCALWQAGPSRSSCCRQWPAHRSQTNTSTRNFKTFPTRATEAGRHDFDGALEDFSPEPRAAWVDFNEAEEAKLGKLLGSDNLSSAERLDLEALQAQVKRELHTQKVLRRADCDPLYWSSAIANATVFLLVRDDLPVEERQQRARARARLLPDFVARARENFQDAKLNEIAPDLCRIAAGQLRASSSFYNEGFARAVGESDEVKIEARAAANALAAFAGDLEELAKKATASPRLQANYATTFRLGTRVTEPVDAVLERAISDLAAKRREAADFGRSVWRELLPNETAPADDAALLRRRR